MVILTTTLCSVYLDSKLAVLRPSSFNLGAVGGGLKMMENVLLNEFTLLESLRGIGFVISASLKCQLNSLQCFASTNPVDVGEQACSYCTCIRQHSQKV